jgi:anti-sigma factor RsiW
MCDFEKKLVAWIDRELSENEAVEVEQHLTACAECQPRMEAYERARVAFNDYCDAVAAANARPTTSRLKLAALGAGAIAAAAVLALFMAHPRQQFRRPQQRVTTPAARAPRAALAEAVPNLKAREANPKEPTPIARKSTTRVHARNVVAPAPTQHASFLPEPAVQIDIPADALLPPGAAPAGANFVVDFSVAPDGSAQGIRVTPQLTGFERRTTQP